MQLPSPFNIQLPKIWQPWRCSDLIRLGKDNDGGYLVSHTDVMTTEKLVSFGIGCDWVFEKQFTDMSQCPLSAFDQRIPPQCYEDLMEFFSGNRQFTETKIVGSQIDSPGSIKQYCQGQSIFLKCDIEGGEYQILDDILNMGDVWSGMVFEVHNINRWENYDAITNFLAKIPLKLLHLHVNNWGYNKNEPTHEPFVLELTLGQGSDTRWDPNYELPHVLDMPNNPNDQEFHMRF